MYRSICMPVGDNLWSIVDVVDTHARVWFLQRYEITSRHVNQSNVASRIRESSSLDKLLNKSGPYLKSKRKLKTICAWPGSLRRWWYLVVKGFNVPSSKERRIACAAGPLLDQGWSLLTVLSVLPIGRFVGLWKKRYREIVWIMRTWKWKEGSVEPISTVKGSRPHSKISFLPLNANNLDFESSRIFLQE